MPADLYTDQAFTVLECRAMLEVLSGAENVDKTKIQSARAKFERGAKVPL